MSVVVPTNSLAGSIPVEIATWLPGLQVLNLNGNRLLGPIPSEFGALQKVSVFQLGGQLRGLSGTVPTELGLLTKLTGTFDLSSNKLSLLIPTELGHLTGVTGSNGFMLHHNSFTGIIPTELAQLKVTSDFQLHSNRFCGTIPAEITAMSSSQVTAGWNVKPGNFFGPTPCEATSALANLYSATGGSDMWYPPMERWMEGDPCELFTSYGVARTAGWEGVECDQATSPSQV